MKTILFFILLGLSITQDEALAQSQTETPQISQATAEAAAQKFVPASVLKETTSGLIDGKACWIVILTRANSKNVTRVEIDGATGKVIASETESGE